jgi:hypothetical protein
MMIIVNGFEGWMLGIGGVVIYGEDGQRTGIGIEIGLIFISIIITI